MQMTRVWFLIKRHSGAGPSERAFSAEASEARVLEVAATAVALYTEVESLIGMVAQTAAAAAAE